MRKNSAVIRFLEPATLVPTAPENSPTRVAVGCFTNLLVPQRGGKEKDCVDNLVRQCRERRKWMHDSLSLRLRGRE